MLCIVFNTVLETGDMKPLLRLTLGYTRLIGNALTLTSGRFRTECLFTRLSVASCLSTCDSSHPLISVCMQLFSSTHLKISTPWLFLPTLSPATCSLIHFSLLSLSEIHRSLPWSQPGRPQLSAVPSPISLLNRSSSTQ